MAVLAYSLIHTFSILSLQLKKLRWHNKSAIDLSNANPGRGHQELRQSTRHINCEGLLLKPTGIQFATKSRLGTTTNGEHRKLIGVKTFVWERNTAFTVWSAASFRIKITSYSIVYLSRWRAVEALRRDCLYTTELESKLILISYPSTSPDL